MYNCTENCAKFCRIADIKSGVTHGARTYAYTVGIQR